MKHSLLADSHHRTERRMLRSVRRRVMCSGSGQALVELALLMPLFTLMLLGAADIARIAYAGIEVSNAARAGVQYGAQNRSTSSDLTGMNQAAINDGPDVTSMRAVSSMSCVCTSGTSITCANAGTACVSPARILEYVQVNTSANVSPLFQIPGLPTTLTLRGKAIMRVNQ